MIDLGVQPQKGFRYFLKKYFVFYGLIFSIAVSFYAGYKVGDDRSPAEQTKSVQEGKLLRTNDRVPSYLSKDVEFSLFWDVWKRVKSEHFVRNTADTKLFYGALAGIVSALDDPYSVFFDPELSKKFDESLSGSFDGIGAEIGAKNNQLQIVAPLPESPAEGAGLRSGDKILAIDKRMTTGMSVDYAVSLIRGKRGTKVTLTIYRDGEKKERDITIKRDTIRIASVTWKVMDGNVGYLKIAHFNQDTEEKFKEAVKDLLAKRVGGIVLDVRNNPGGYLDTAVQVAGYWVDGKPVVIEQYSNQKKDEYTSRVRALLADMKTVVLVNEGSASASEIVAGALQDYGKAVLIGKKTFGKGSVQDLQHLKDGSSLKLTIAKWLTPKGRSIDEEGVKPDIEVELKDSDIEQNKDPQLEKALEVVKAKK